MRTSSTTILLALAWLAVTRAGTAAPPLAAPAGPAPARPAATAAPAAGPTSAPARYYPLKSPGPKQTSPPARKARATPPPSAPSGPTEKTEKRLVYEFFIFDLLLSMAVLFVVRDAFLSSGRVVDPWQRAGDLGAGESGAPEAAALAPSGGRLHDLLTGTPRRLAAFACLLLAASVSVTFALYGSLILGRHGPRVQPAITAPHDALPFQAPSGRGTEPRQMPYIFLATSPDGVHWEKDPTFRVRKGGTHKMTAGDGGRIWVYVSDGEHRVERGTFEPGARGLDDVQPVAIAGEADGKVLDPMVVRLPDANPARARGHAWRMYYLFTRQQGDPSNSEAVNEFHSALSPDGVHFEREPGVRLQGKGVTDPDVIRLADGTWRMYFTRFPGQIQSASSTDGVTFKEEGLRFVNAWVSSSLLEADGRVRLWFQSLDDQQKGTVHTAVSPDGLGFFIDGREVLRAGPTASRDGQGVFHPAVLRLAEGRYIMLYSSGEVFGSRAAAGGNEGSHAKVGRVVGRGPLLSGGNDS